MTNKKTVESKTPSRSWQNQPNLYSNYNLERIAQLAATICEMPLAKVTLLDSSQSIVETSWPQIIEGIQSESFFRATLETPEAILEIPDTRLDTDFKDHPWVTQTPHIRFYAGVTLTLPGSVRLGVLSVMGTTPHTLTTTQRASLELLGKNMAQELETWHAWVEANTQRAMLFAILSKLAHELNPDNVMQQAMNAIVQSHEWKYACITQLTPDQEHWVVCAGNDFPGNRIGITYPLTRGIIGRTYRTGQMQLVKDVTQDPEYFLSNSNHKPGSELAIPIQVEGKVLGVLNLESDELDAFTKNDVAFASSIADVIAVALNQSQQFVRLQKEVAERRQVEQTLRRNEERYQQFISQSFQGIYRTEFDEPIDTQLPIEEQIDQIYENAYMAESNQALADMYRLPSLDDLIGTRLMDTHGGKDNSFKRTALRKFIENGYKSINDETMEYDAQGNPIWFLSNTIGTIEKGKLVRLWGTCMEITDRKAIEQSNKHYNEQLSWVLNIEHALAASLNEAEIYETLAAGIQLLFSDVATLFISSYDDQREMIRAVYGCQDGELVDTLTLPEIPLAPPGQGTQSQVIRTRQPLRIHSDLKSKFHSSVKINIGDSKHETQSAIYIPMLAQEKVLGLIQLQSYQPNRFTEEDMRILTLVSNTAAVSVQNARLFLTVQVELIERNQSELALKRSEEKYRSLMESIDSQISTIDEDGRFMYLNDAAANQLGKPAEELIGRTLHSLLPQPAADKQLEIIQQVLRTNQRAATENLLPSGGEWRWYRTYVQPVHDETGQVSYVLVNATDIHDLKSAQQELERLNRTLEDRVARRTAEVEDLYDNAPNGYHSLDANGFFVRMNQTELNWLGYQREEIIGKKKFSDLLTPNSWQTFDKNFGLFKRNGWITDLEFEIICKDGQVLQVLVNASAIYDELGNFVASRSTMVDITRRKKAENTLRESEAQNRLLFEESPDAILVLNEQGCIWRANHAFCNLVHMNMDDLVGKKPDTLGLVSPETTTLWANTLAQTVYTHEAFAVAEYLIYDAHGIARNVEGRLFQVQIEGVTHMMLSNRDVSVRKQAENALRRANQEMERAMRMKDEFLASMSHELRTPLTGILGISEALQYNTYGELSEKQNGALSTIEKSGRHLLELINDILDLSKIGAGKMDLQFEPCSLGEICQSSLQMIKGMAHKKLQKVVFQMTPASVNMRGDARRLKQILVNLLSNAVKFTQEHGELGLEVLADEQTQVVNITVWDTGVGIAESDLNKLFQPFVQLDSSLTRQHSGTGLGLALVQKLTDLHGGSVSVQSEPGKGSRFVISLPILITGLTQKRPNDPVLATQIKHALVLEETSTDAERMARYLRMLGIEPYVISTSKDMITRILEIRPGVIILAEQRAGISNLEILKSIKIDPQFGELPILLTSETGSREQAARLGAAGFLPKPYALADLRNVLLPLEHIHASPSVSESYPSEPTQAKIMIVDDNEINILVLEDFLSSQQYEVVSAQSGADCLACIAEFRPDIVLMDVQMPGMDGLETMRRLRSLPDRRLAELPVIAITALAMPGDREMCLAAGAHEYISKPVRLQELQIMIQRLLMRRKTHGG